MGQEHSQVDWECIPQTGFKFTFFARWLPWYWCYYVVVVSLLFVFIKLTPDSLFVGFYTSNS